MLYASSPSSLLPRRFHVGHQCLVAESCSRKQPQPRPFRAVDWPAAVVGDRLFRFESWCSEPANLSAHGCMNLPFLCAWRWCIHGRTGCRRHDGRTGCRDPLAAEILLDEIADAVHIRGGHPVVAPQQTAATPVKERARTITRSDCKPN